MDTDVIRFKIDKDKQDDLAYFSLGVLSLTWLAFGSIVVAIFITILFIIAYVAYLNKDLIQSWFEKPEPTVEERPVMEEKPQKSATSIGEGKITLGRLVRVGLDRNRVETNIPVRVDIEDMGHTFIMGMTGYGKTTMLYWIITQIIQNYSEEDVKIAFSDAKGVSFNVFSKSKHLFAPIATNKEETEALIILAEQEMNRRRDLFKRYANDRVCTNTAQYEKITGEKLPYIIFVFDELADAVEKNGEAEQRLITLAKMSRSAGIRLIMATQRPTVAGISHEVQVQCQTLICGYMKSSREYGTVAQIPQTVYRNMTAKPGLSVMFLPSLAPGFIAEMPDGEGWGLIQGNYLSDEQIEAIAQKNAGTPTLAVLPVVEALRWEGTEDDKLTLLAKLEEKLGRDLETRDVMATFEISYPTAKTWIDRYYA